VRIGPIEPARCIEGGCDEEKGEGDDDGGGGGGGEADADADAGDDTGTAACRSAAALSHSAMVISDASWWSCVRSKESYPCIQHRTSVIRGNGQRTNSIDESDECPTGGSIAINISKASNTSLF
jgi:hypothetical protein